MNRSVAYFNFVGLRWLFSVLFVLAFADGAVSQAVGYVCDFEDSAENAMWQLNVGNQGEQCANKWYIGEPGRNNGANGLFVSGDNGVSTGYNKTGVSVVSYRSITVPAGKYELTFEWQAFGMDSLDGLYVCWVPDSVKTNSVSNSNLQKWVSQYVVPFGSVGRLYQRSWNVACDTIESDGTPHKLVFVWNNGVVGTYPPAACVDNIMILAYGFCDKPSDLKVSSDNGNVLFSWNGNSDLYDVKCYSQETGKWVIHNGVKDTFISIGGLDEGLVDYYVRSSCGEFYSSWMSISEFLYYPGIRCVDYLTLNQYNCYFGSVGKPMAYRGKIDHGFQSKNSRHTVHWSKTERDPRTNNMLKTVPDGEIASVRLGNWDIHGEAESVEFEYPVDASSSAVLILKYAVVLEDPNHEEWEQPRFTLKVLRGNKPLDKLGCAEADFSAGYSTQGWYVNDSVTWKDWTTVGINLHPYDGDTLTIRLTTYDCTQSGHYGYAYFVLGCSDGKITGLSCGDSPTNSFKGPDGFLYRWYHESDPDNVLCEEQVFTVGANDTLTYNLDVIQPTKLTCYYTLQASALPRYPVPLFEYADSVIDCQNVVSFTNKSYVRRVNHITSDTIIQSSDKCETTKWDFGDGTFSTDENPRHVFPRKGGQYKVTLYSGIANDACVEDTTYTIDLPRLDGTNDTVYAEVCEGDFYEFDGQKFYDSTIYHDTIVGSHGCDSVITLNLTMHKRYELSVSDTICSNEEYYFGDKLITETGVYKDTFNSVYGCDSVVELDITVNEVLDMTIDNVFTACAGDEYLDMPFTINSGMLTSYSIEFTDDAMKSMSQSGLGLENGLMRVPLENDILPGNYNAILKFGGQSCGLDNMPISVRIFYNDSVIAQRWNDVLSVRNTGYNGGYTFVAYQWYKNDVPLEGSVSPNCYIEEGLDPDAKYTVMLTRLSDGVSQMVCPVSPLHFDNMPEITVNFYSDENISYVSVSENCSVAVWNSLGVLVEKFEDVGENESIELNYTPGIYFVEVVLSGGSRKVEKVIVR